MFKSSSEWNSYQKYKKKIDALTKNSAQENLSSEGIHKYDKKAFAYICDSHGSTALKKKKTMYNRLLL